MEMGENKIPIKEGLFTMPLTPLEKVRLLASKCKSCAEVGLGKRFTCAHCGGQTLEEISLSRRGKLWTYTVIRHKPPGDFKGPDPFVPFALGLVELSEGIRVLSPINCDLDKLKIGMNLELEVYPLYVDENKNIVIAFRFRSAEEEKK